MGRPDPKIRDAMLAHLRRNQPDMCRHWFDDIEVLEISNGTLWLVVHEPVQLKYLQRTCSTQFTEAAQVATGRLLAVRFVGEQESRQHAAPSSSSRATSAAAATGGGASRASASRNSGGNDASVQPALSSRAAESEGARIVVVEPKAAPGDLDRDREVRSRDDYALPHHDDMILSPDYSFDNFVAGPGNRLALAGAMAVAEKPGRAYNPFFIHGGVGLGKTHLLQAICQAAMRARGSQPPLRIYYVSCDGFRSQFEEAVRRGVMHDFRHCFRNVDMLVVDDIHDLSQNELSQEEFFHTFNSLYQSGKQVVLSSDAAPVEIPALEERLVSRFSCGLVAKVDKPCYETRVAIAKRKAALRQYDVPDDVASYVAARIDTNIRELEGAIVKIQGFALTYNRPIDLDLAKEAIGEREPRIGAGLSIQSILDAITAYYGCRLSDLLSKLRNKSITRPRQVGIYLARRYTRHSLEDIGSYFGGRDHSTVLHSIRIVEQRRKADPIIDREVTTLEQRLLGQPPLAEAV
jgi:chromosomal replication initiator protein